MPSISERVRRPLDESMLLRLVLVTGLIRGSELAKFYAAGGGGLDGSKTLEDFLLEHGVDSAQLSTLKRAYVETHNFGTTLVDYLRARHADEDKLAAAAADLSVCETEQLMDIKSGKPPRPIGEMMVERGHINAGEIDELIRRQGMMQKFRRYSEAHREMSTLAGRLHLKELRARLKRAKMLPIVLAVALLIAIVWNLWSFGVLRTAADPVFPGIRGNFAAERNHDPHVRNIYSHYANLIDALRSRDMTAAEHYRGALDTYFQRLSEEKVHIEDLAVVRIQSLYSVLDFGKLKDIPPRDLPLISLEELEARLRP